MGRGGGSEALPLQKGWARNVLAFLKGGGGTTRFGVVLTRVLEVLTKLDGRGGGGGGGHNKFHTRDFPIL